MSQDRKAMGSINVGDAIKAVMESNGWKAKIQEIKLKRDWETIVGKTIARYTASILLRDRVLTISTNVAPLKQELQYAKEQLIQNINDFYKEKVVSDIIIR